MQGRKEDDGVLSLLPENHAALLTTKSGRPTPPPPTEKSLGLHLGSFQENTVKGLESVTPEFVKSLPQNMLLNRCKDSRVGGSEFGDWFLLSLPALSNSEV